MIIIYSFPRTSAKGEQK